MNEEEQKAPGDCYVFEEISHLVLISKIRVKDHCRCDAEPGEGQRYQTGLPTKDDCNAAQNFKSNDSR